MEIADRLNAVGRDISILIQPMDLVKQLKKGLKSIKGYKDYIVMWYSPSLLVETHARVPFLYFMFFCFQNGYKLCYYNFVQIYWTNSTLKN